MKRREGIGDYCTNFALFNLVFLALQFAYILSQGGSFLKAIPLPITVYIELATALIIQILLYVLLTFIQTAMLWGIAEYLPTKKALERWQMTIFCLSLTALLTANCYFFPLSAFSRLFLPGLPLLLLKITFYLSLLILGLLILNTLWQAWHRRPVVFSCIFLVCLSTLFFLSYEKDQIKHDRIVSNTPNIFLIGIDSLSPERVSAQNTPNLDKFIQQSIVFKETVSPLARTYSAWASILTGMYPLHHQARYNLMPADIVKSKESIVWTAQSMGYQTVFATDDRRFSSISNDFGFEKVIGPKLGVNDVLLGTFNDFPLSNLLINLPISRWLFPYNYLNRSSHFSYYPSTFDRVLHQFIKQHNPQTPLFMAVHFTLPHWPYAWAASSPAQVKNEYSVQERGQLYLDAVYKADEQIGKFLTALQQADLLQNSLVIVLSDHGEALYEPGSRPLTLANYQGKQENKLSDYFKRKTSTTLEMSAGHGSDLLSPAQFFCLLGFKIFNQGQLITVPGKIDRRVALIDIAPTIYAFLNLPLKKNFDGISLLNALTHHEPPPDNRVFMLESGELPNQIVSREKARKLGKLLYRVNPENGQLQIRKDKLAILDALKLYAILDDDWIVALYPDDFHYITVILRLSDDKWTDSLESSFAQTSPAPEMLKQLLQFYKNELASYPKSKLKPNLLDIN
ncbi:putative Sulfatase [Legionella feeleii]|uniref:Putative Sulfatase n=1 Tax=Legionella feeleii TaxID=453 RepID=A0A0W0U545_9GAMM|nr:putative Sulfatase [Legionella feeleii]SPX59959.1 putative Sulfatase [Legionella feeleii]